MFLNDNRDNFISKTVKDCSMCNKPISVSKVGMESHLRQHTRKGEITHEQKRTIIREMFPDIFKERNKDVK